MNPHLDCPRCGRPDAIIITSPTSETRRLECQRCRVRGGEEDTAAEAMHAWNRGPLTRESPFGAHMPTETFERDDALMKRSGRRG